MTKYGCRIRVMPWAGSDAWRVTISLGGQVQHPVSLRRAERDNRRQLGRGIAVARVSSRA
jgi:hypothetical protein